MPWQPPIPAGALYSKPARQLGPALALLAYCYDLVQRDGWFEIVLKDAASDMEEPYQNVKRWWAMLRAGPFFCEAIDRGKRGWRVCFKDVWIDRRILSTRPKAAEPSSTNEVPEMVLEGDGASVKYKSSTNEVPEMVLDQTAYKEDRHIQESSSPTQIETSVGGGDDFLKTLIREHGIGAKRAREIVATGVDPETCYQSIRNRVDPKDGNTLGRVILDLIAAPPETGKPYPRPPPVNNGHKPDARPPLPVYQAPAERPDPQAAAKAIVQAMKKENNNERTA